MNGDAVVIELEPLDQLQIEENAQDQLEERDSDNELLLKARGDAKEVVEGSDSRECDDKSRSDGQENAKNPILEDDAEKKDKETDSAFKKGGLGSNVSADVTVEESCKSTVPLEQGSMQSIKDVTLPWIIFEAIQDGDVVKVRRWLESLPTHQRQKAYLFRLSPKFHELCFETAFHHAVYKCDEPEIPALFLSAAGEKLLDADIVSAIKRGNTNSVQSWLRLKVPSGKCDEYKYWDGSTALHLAAKHNQVKVAELLIDKGADPNATRRLDGVSILHIAYSNIRLLEILLNQRKFAIDATDNKAFLHVVKRGNLTLTEKMLQRQPLLVNQRGSNGVTALHLASEQGNYRITELLLNNGADVTIIADDRTTPLHLASKNGLKVIVGLLLRNGAKVDARNCQMWTPMHFACKEGHLAVTQELIQYKGNIDAMENKQWTPLHFTSKEGHLDITKALIDKGANVSKLGRDGESPLHLACKNGHLSTARVLIEKSSLEIHAEDKEGRTPLHFACIDGHFDIAKLLLQHRARTNRRDDNSPTPMLIACQNGHDDIVQLLLDYEVEIKPDMLKTALEQHHESIVRTLVNKCDNWPMLMRQKWRNEDDIETTPFREMIKLAPDAAEDVLNMCTVKTTSRAYAIAFNYEFVEDFAIGDASDHTDSGPENRPKETKFKSRCSYEEVKCNATSDYSTSWGPTRFSKYNHPLSIMVQYERLNLLQHPLISCLLHRKWRKFGQYFYFGNLLAYSIFLLLLTTFALIVPNPQSHICSESTYNGTENQTCEILPSSRQGGIYFTGIVVIILAVCRLALEVYQLISQRMQYFQDWVNWLEWCLSICAIIFVSVFRNQCLCVGAWQWQIGIMAVFLGWIELISFLSKLPLVGLYVVMFLEILKTVLKLIVFSCLLFIAFGLAFYMAFFEPNIMRSPFSTVPRSLLKTFTMSTGELEFDTIFRQNPTGASAGFEEIPFPAVSYILWIVFIILMPVLLTNMLIGLAVGDIGAIQQVAELKKLSLQVEQVLTIEDLLPKRIQRKLRSGYKELYPNKREVSFQELLQFLFCCICCACMSRWWYETKGNKNYKKQKRRISRHAQFIMWGGVRYDTHGKINRVVKPPEDAVSKTDKVLRSVKELKVSSSKEKETTDKLYDRQGTLLRDVVELKVDKKRMDKLVLDQRKHFEEASSKVDQILQEVEHMKKKFEEEGTELLDQVKEMKDASTKDREEILKKLMDSHREREVLLQSVKELMEVTLKEKERNDKLFLEMEEVKVANAKDKDIFLNEIHKMKETLQRFKVAPVSRQD